MKQILILYYSRTGNTGGMAKAVAEGAKISDDVKVELNYHVEPEDLDAYEAILVGTPTYHHEMAVEFKNLFEEAAAKGINLKGKVGAAFGSYGWSGEAPKLVLEIMKLKFEMQVAERPLLSRYSPDQKTLTDCRNLGKRVSENLMSKA
ncbi:MAG TPA: flavodoxin domain-containing protein [Candidatus Bathyarchaeia archaeon]|nr:flavodoxin domain-containing protein [Candidatus Bathyarchaeia archaeon]